jgi:hypothetical protein
MSRWRTPFLAALTVMLGACAVDDQSGARVADDESVPFGLLEPDAPALLPTSTVAATETATVCFVSGAALAPLPVALAPPIRLDDVVAALGEPPEIDGATLRTAVADPPIVREVDLRGGIARVDLLPAVSNLGGDDQLLAVAQLVCSLTARPGVGQISFTLGGAPVDVPRGDGSLTSDPVSRDDYAALLA